MNLKLTDPRTNWKYILIVAVLGLVVSGGIVWYANMPTPASQPIEILNIQKPTPQQTVDTSTWQTYRNDEFGFEVKYPKGWGIRKDQFDTVEITNRNDSYIFISPTGNPPRSFQGMADFKIRKDSFAGQPVSIVSILTSDVVEEIQQSISFLGYPKGWSKYNYIISGISTSTFKRKCAVDITPEHPECTIEDGVKFFGEVSLEEKTVIDQILSTFRFVE